MIRGTTPKHTFKVPFNADEALCVRVVYRQGDTKVRKTDVDLNKSGNTVSVRLGQEDTLAFKANGDAVKAQISAKIKIEEEELVAKSKVISIKCYETLDDEVL